MVRVNIINPTHLADQHLIAEYNEIIMLVAYARKHPKLEKEKIPKKYCLGTGHILFFKNKLLYLKKRHEQLIKEMKRRGFSPKRRLSISGVNKKLMHGWKPDKKDKEIIKKRLIQRIRKQVGFYKYYRKKRTMDFFRKLIKKG